MLSAPRPGGGELRVDQSRSSIMAKNVILWMLGVPISVLILLNIFGFL
jgi:hypothetical protein